MDPNRTRGVAAGVFFLVAAVAAIAATALYHPVLDDPRYVVDAARTDTQVLAGAFLEVLVVLSVIGTGVALYPVIRRESEGLATGYLVGRLLEGAIIAVGIVSLLAVVGLRRDGAGDDATLVTTGKALVALHDATFLVGPGLIIGVNTLLLATIMYRSGLVPRRIAQIGLVGGPLVFVSSVAVLFGAYEQLSALAGLAAFPVFAWEMSLAAWMIVKGFAPADERSGRASDRASRLAAAAA